MINEWSSNVPVQRRLELLSVGAFIFFILFGGIAFTIVLILLLVITCFLLPKSFSSLRIISDPRPHFQELIFLLLLIISQIYGNTFWRILCVSYLVFYYIDFDTPSNGGRGIG